MSKRSEDMAPLRSRRVHKDPKKKILLSTHKVKHQALEVQNQGLEVKIRPCSCSKNCQPDRNQKDHHAFEEGLNADQREVVQRDCGSLLMVG
jgi:hypothetical protein